MHGFGVNIILFPIQNVYLKLEVISHIQENETKK